MFLGCLKELLLKVNSIGLQVSNCEKRLMEVEKTVCHIGKRGSSSRDTLLSEDLVQLLDFLEQILSLTNMTDLKMLESKLQGTFVVSFIICNYIFICFLASVIHRIW